MRLTCTPASWNRPQWEITKFSFITCDPATAGGKSGSLLSQLLMTSPSMSLLFEHENHSQLRKKRNEKDSQWQILQYQPQAWSSVSYLQSWGLNCSYALDLSRTAVRKLPAWFVGFAATQRSTWPSLTASVRSFKSVPWCCPTQSFGLVCIFIDSSPPSMSADLQRC